MILFTGGWGSLSGGLCPGGSLSRAASVQGGLCPGVSVQGGLSGRPPAAVRLRVGGTHLTGMHSCLSLF